MKVVTRKVIDSDRIQRILIRGVNWVGDAVMTTPAIAQVRKTFPHAKIVLLVKPRVAGVFEGNPHINEILLYEQDGRHKGVLGLLRLARQLRDARFDLAILLQNAIEAALIAVLAQIPYRIGYNTQGRGFLLTDVVLRDRWTETLHHVDYYQALVSAVGWVKEEVAPTLYLSEGAEERAGALLEGEGVRSEEAIVALNPGATYGSAKQWPADRYAALADRLVEDFGMKVLLTGVQADGPAARVVRSSTRYPERVIDLTGRTDIQELGAVLRRCAVFVTNDTGAMHVGAAVGVPVVAIFGPTDPKTTSPVGPHVLLRHPVPCSPCLLRECPIDHRCMTGISVEAVYSEVSIIYRRNSEVIL